MKLPLGHLCTLVLAFCEIWLGETAGSTRHRAALALCLSVCSSDAALAHQ